MFIRAGTKHNSQMTKRIVAEIVSSEDKDSYMEVVVRTEKLSPMPSDLMIRERARVRALVEAGIADSISHFFVTLSRNYELTNLTTIESVKTTSADYPPKKEFVIRVNK